MNELINQMWIQLGAIGLIIGGLSITVVILYRDHNKERKEWNKELNKRHEQMIDVQQETNTTIARNTQAVEGLKEYIKAKG